MIATKRAADTLIILVVMLLAWQALHQFVGTTALPGPVPTLTYLAKFVPTERFAENAWATLVCFFYALILSYGIGLAIGVWMGIHRLSGAVGEPILISLYTLPKVTLYPVVLLIFGLSLSGRVTFGAMHGVLPVALLTMNAIRNIPPVYLKSARTFTYRDGRLFSTVLFPGDTARDGLGPPDRLHLDAARGASGRDVRREAWIGLSDNQCHADAAGRGDDCGRGGAVCIRSARQCAASMDRASASWRSVRVQDLGGHQPVLAALSCRRSRWIPSYL